jgi:hypothetical protein
MRADNLRFGPVRLGMRRVRKGAWWITRGGEEVGEVSRVEGGWESYPGRMGETEGGVRALMLDRAGVRLHGSFVGAALRVGRLRGLWSARVQDYGAVRMVRVSVSGRWYAVVWDGHGVDHVFEDRQLEVEGDYERAMMRMVLLEAGRVLGDGEVVGGERELVARWLRWSSGAWVSEVGDLLVDVADQIERGDHARWQREMGYKR